MEMIRELATDVRDLPHAFIRGERGCGFCHRAQNDELHTTTGVETAALHLEPLITEKGV